MYISRGPNITHEKITNSSTILGAIALTTCQIALRFILLIPLCCMAILVGRGFGVLLIMASVLTISEVNIHSVFPPNWIIHTHPGNERDNKKAGALFSVGMLFVAMWLYDLWPSIYWTIGDGKMWLAHKTGSIGLAPVWLWTRLAACAVIPFAFTSPLRGLDWVFDIERTLPKFRETNIMQVSPAGIKLPDGSELQPATRQQHTQQQQQDSGPNPVDNTLLVEVDGV